VSPVSDYHNGSFQGQAAVGRQRWGDYSAVSLDPTNEQSFWAIGQFAREWNNAAGGHPAGTGGSRWGTWISEITTEPISGVPDSGSTVTMMLVGLLSVLAAARRSRL
jgi:hypothetical protein